MITIRGYNVEVDVARELEKYDWSRPRWTGEKFLACSPFRNERTPSFAVRLDSGVWIDSGTSDENWKKGNFIKLLAYLRNETYEESEDYLLDEYHAVLGDPDALQLNVKLTMGEQKWEPLDKDVLTPFLFRHSYLQEQRGIEERIQRAFKVGYDKRHRAVTFPWLDRSGEVANVKFRSVVDKYFWYLAGGQPIKNHIYGLHFVHKGNKNRVYIVESEIDCLTLWQHGFPAVALGGVNMTPKQRELILQSPIECLIMATDNDKAGRTIAQSIWNQLNGFVEIETIDLPEQIKDINDLTSGELLQVVSKTRRMTIKWDVA